MCLVVQLKKITFQGNEEVGGIDYQETFQACCQLIGASVRVQAYPIGHLLTDLNNDFIFHWWGPKRIIQSCILNRSQAHILLTDIGSKIYKPNAEPGILDSLKPPIIKPEIPLFGHSTNTDIGKLEDVIDNPNELKDFQTMRDIQQFLNRIQTIMPHRN